MDGLIARLMQRSIYQEYLAKSLTDKYQTLSTQLDKIINDANSEITTLRDKLSCASRADWGVVEQRADPY